MSKISKLTVFRDLESFYQQVGLSRQMSRVDFVKNIINYKEEDDLCSSFLSYFTSEMGSYSQEEAELYQEVVTQVRALHKIITKGLPLDNLNDLIHLAQEAQYEQMYVTDFQVLPCSDIVKSASLEAKGFLFPATVMTPNGPKSLVTDNLSDRELISFSQATSLAIFRSVIHNNLDNFKGTLQERVFEYYNHDSSAQDFVPIVFVNKETHVKDKHLQVANSIISLDDCITYAPTRALIGFVDNFGSSVKVVAL